MWTTMRYSACWLVGVGLIGSVDLMAEETNWPNWRGHRFDHVSTETGWRSDGLSTTDLVRWQANVGIGYSSVSGTREHVFTMGHVEGQEAVYCLRNDDGKQR